jgi:hypothetical protein
LRERIEEIGEQDIEREVRRVGIVGHPTTTGV